MPGLIGLIWTGANIATGFHDLPWFWCLLTATIGIPIYYAVKNQQLKESTLAQDGMTLLISDIQRSGFVKWFLWIYLTQLATAFTLFGIGLGVAAIF